MLATPVMQPGAPPLHLTDHAIDSIERVFDDPINTFPRALTRSAELIRLNQPSKDLDILSASQYPQLPHGLGVGLKSHQQQSAQPHQGDRASQSYHATTTQLYGGLLYDSRREKRTVTKNGTSMATRKRTRKSQALSQSGDESNEGPGSKKQRGRPRLETQDETAADRRRTQIRLAQRAYRTRKETTITALKQRVNDLHGTIEQMNSTFLALYDNLIDAGVTANQPALTKQLKQATDTFTELSKVGDIEIDEDWKMDEITGNKKMSPPGQTSTGRNEEADIDRTRSQNEVQPTPPEMGHTYIEDVDMFSPNETSRGHMSDDATMWQANPNAQPMQFHVQLPDHQFSEDWLGGRPSLALSKIERPLVSNVPHSKGSYTYSFQETSFARRLHRMCLERAFRNLTNTKIEPEYIKRAFRFTFCFSNRKRMVRRFQDILQRKAGESLENWNVPFFYIGGAGTHFPRRDPNGQPIYPPNMASPAKAFGPQRGPQAVARVETPRKEETTEEMLEAIGYGGMWFDSHDVEEYLKTKGIYLDGSSNYVDIDPSLVTPRFPSAKSSSNTESTSSKGSPTLRTPSPSHAFITESNANLLDPLTRSSFTSEPGDATFASFNDDIYPLLHAAEKELRQQQQQSQIRTVQDRQIWPWPEDPPFVGAHASTPQNLSSFRFQQSPASATTDYTPSFADTFGLSGGQSVTFDVEKFLNRMVDGAACLGRAPGYRKELVDNALVMSLAEAF